MVRRHRDIAHMARAPHLEASLGGILPRRRLHLSVGLALGALGCRLRTRVRTDVHASTVMSSVSLGIEFSHCFVGAERTGERLAGPETDVDRVATDLTRLFEYRAQACISRAMQ